MSGLQHVCPAQFVTGKMSEARFCHRWAATLGIVLAASRAFIVEPGTAFEPELALLETVAHTHYLPRHWRGRAHTREVQTQFQQLFQFKVRYPGAPQGYKVVSKVNVFARKGSSPVALMMQGCAKEQSSRFQASSRGA